MLKPYLLTPEVGCVLLFSCHVQKVSMQSFYCVACEVRGDSLLPFAPFGHSFFVGAHGALGVCRYPKEEKVYPRSKHTHQSVPKELWMGVYWEDLCFAHELTRELKIRLPKGGFRRDGWAV